jgi:hypothetical protein
MVLDFDIYIYIYIQWFRIYPTLSLHRFLESDQYIFVFSMSPLQNP